jgi:hypothetical protein
MAKIENFDTNGQSITLSLDISNVNIITPVLTKVRLDVFDGENFYSIPITDSLGNNLGNIRPHTIGKGINYKRATLIFTTFFRYPDIDSLPERLAELDLIYSLEESGNTQEYKKFDNYYTDSNKVARIIKYIGLI